MIGDAEDMASRIRAMLPAGWFGEADSTPILNALLLGKGTAFSGLWSLLQSVILQARIATASGIFLDMISTDYFGNGMVRLPIEQDSTFRLRIQQNLLRSRGTRVSITLALQQLTGKPPTIFEPTNTADTGGYSLGGIGYGVAGGWGSLALPFQCFITVLRPSGGGIPELAGYGSGGVPVYGSLTMEVSGLPDSVIMAAVSPLLPASTIAWMRLAN